MSHSAMKKPLSITGKAPTINDINQGQVGDCYFVSSLSAFAVKPYRLENAILTKTVNKAGLFAMQVYVKGVPH